MIAVNDIMRVVLNFDMPNSVIAQLVWHYLATAGTPETEASVLAFILNNAENAFAGILADISDLVSGNEIDMFVRDVAAAQWDGVAADLSVALDGTSVSDMLPHGDAAMMSFFTDLGRRKGRKFIMGYTENSITDGVWIGADVTQLGTAALIFDNDIATASLTIVPGNYNVDPTSALFETFQPWNKTVEISTICNYQRRRRPGVGM